MAFTWHLAYKLIILTCHFCILPPALMGKSQERSLRQFKGITNTTKNSSNRLNLLERGKIYFTFLLFELFDFHRDTLSTSCVTFCFGKGKQKINTGGREDICIITTALVIYHLGYHCMKATVLQLEPTCSECRLKPFVLHLHLHCRSCWVQR